MFITCPKCGFHQPEDRYCAQCGVDMQAYKPKEPFFLLKYARDTRFQVGGLVAVSLVLVYLALGGAPVSSVDLSETSTAETDFEQDPDYTPRAKIKRKGRPRSQQYQRQKVVEPKPQKKAQKTPAAPTRLAVTFAQLESSQLNALLSSSRNLGGDGMTAITFAAGGDNTKIGSSYSGLPGGRLGELGQNLIMDWQYADESDENFGFVIEIENIGETSAEFIELSVEGYVRLKGTDTIPPVSNSFSGQFQFRPQDVLILYGMIPHEEISEEELSAASGSPLQIMTQPGFLNNEVDFLVVIQPKP